MRMMQPKRPTKEVFARFSWVFAIGLCFIITSMITAKAQRIANNTAVFSALDKVTARIRKLEIPVNETIRFGSLKITPRICYSSPPEVRPKTSTFVQVDEVMLNGEEKRIFSGWMFAESPALNAVEHPVFDVWLTGCGQPERSAKAQSTNSQNRRNPEVVPQPLQRRRVKR